MRVLAVTSSYPKYPGDVTAPFIESITRALVARGHVVDVILPEHPELDRPREQGIHFAPYHYAPAKPLTLWGYAQSLEADVRVRPAVYALVPLVALALRRSVSAHLQARRYDAALVHWVVPNAVLIDDLLDAHRLPFVVSLHGSDVFVAERHAVVGSAARRVFLRAGSVTACSGDLLGRAQRLGATAERSRVLPYGVDVQHFAPGPADDAFRLHLGVSASRTLVLAVGRLVEKKGFAYLIEAAAQVPEVQLAIAGDGDLRGELEARARAVGVTVAFLGNLDRGAVASALAAADVVAVPSVVDRAGNVDGLPNVLLEAMAAGRAVVASRVAGIPDVIDDGRNGILVPPEDAAALAAALRRLAGDAALRQRLGSAARRDVVERLSWGAHAASLEECLVQASALAAR